MIKVKDLQKTFDGYKLNISMEVPAGRVTGLVGKNGAGKSTTIKLILGLIQPTSGTVKVFDTDSSLLTIEEKEQIGVALAEAGFSNYLTIDDIVKILKKMYKDFEEERFVKKCSEQSLPMKKQIKDFSAGMKAKLRVLVAMTHKAKLLILDEPTAGLDVYARGEILDMLRDYLAEDEMRTILVTSHIASDLESLCDDIYLINDGEILFHEETDVLLDQYGILKMDEDHYEKLDRSYILNSIKQPYGYACFTNQKQFYAENYPDITIEKGGIDELILMTTGGYRG